MQCITKNVAFSFLWHHFVSAKTSRRREQDNLTQHRKRYTRSWKLRQSSHLEGEAEGILKTPPGESTAERGLATLEPKLHRPSSLLPLVPPSGRLPFPRPNTPPFPFLLLPRPLVIPQIVQAQQARRRRRRPHRHPAVRRPKDPEWSKARIHRRRRGRRWGLQGSSEGRDEDRGGSGDWQRAADREGEVGEEGEAAPPHG